MAQTPEPVAGQKRGPSRPAKAAEPALKKTRISTAGQSPLGASIATPSEHSPAPSRRPNKLPAKVLDSRPLPALTEPQALPLSNDEYQGIAASAVLQASLDRSRLKWVCDGVFERYWVKPESGKNAKPLPPNNPEVKWQKSKGPCRIRIEPHIFEAEIYVEEKAIPKPAPVKQHVPPNHQSAYGQPYRQSQQPYGQQNTYYQSRTLPPIQQTHDQSATNSNTLPPLKNVGQSPAPQPPPSRAQQTPPQQQEKKASPDPVIGMLANRASSDPELKALMKEVATGNATQDQLKVFQSHIDELTKVIGDKKKKDEEDQAVADAVKIKQQQSEVIQYDGPADSVPVPRSSAPQQPYHQHQTTPVYQQPQQHQTWTQPVPTTPPVLLAFTTPGATEDRFLFPQYSILESLSPQHLLTSFIVTRKGRDAADPTGLDPVTEYWQPITLMVEVAYNREPIIGCIKRWVKPADEVKRHMQEVMQRCRKAPDSYLALRLPWKGSAIAETEDVTMEDTPAQAIEEVKKRPNVKYVKKAKPAPDTTSSGPKKAGAEVTGLSAAASTAVQEAIPAKAIGQADGAADGVDGTSTSESGRPRRAVRKSVRINES